MKGRVRVRAFTENPERLRTGEVMRPRNMVPEPRTDGVYAQAATGAPVIALRSGRDVSPPVADEAVAARRRQIWGGTAKL